MHFGKLIFSHFFKDQRINAKLKANGMGKLGRVSETGIRKCDPLHSLTSNFMGGHIPPFMYICFDINAMCNHKSHMIHY